MADHTIEEIAALPFHRPGAENFDCAYAVRVWDARNRIAFNKMIADEPHKPHESPDGLLHYIPNEPAQENKAGATSTGGVFKAPDSVSSLAAPDSPSRRLPNNPGAGSKGDEQP